MNRSKTKVSLVIIMLFVLLGSILGGCSSDDRESVMIYTSIYPDIIELMKPEIEKALPDIRVEWFQGGTESVITKITGEVEANRVEADLLMVADPSYYLTLQSQGLLEKYDSPERAHTSLKDSDGYWTGVRISNMIIAYNTERVSEAEAPRSFEDLLDPKWKDRIAMPSPLLSGTAFVTAGALSNKYGWEYFVSLRENGLIVESGNSAVQNKLLTGEYDVVIILEENILKLADAGEPVKVVYPEDGTIIIPSPIAILEPSSNKDAAKKVLDWFLTKEGQELIVRGWMHSVREDVSSPIGAQPLSSFLSGAMETNWEQFSTQSEQIKETFRERVID